MNLLKAIVRRIMKIPLKFYMYISPVECARYMGAKIGVNCRILRTSIITEPYLVTIGNHVTLTGVKLITHDGGVWVFRDKHPDIDVFGTIKIGNNVFVGTGTIILPNVIIGDNCVVGAGSIVTKDIPPNSVAVGAPAQVIKSIDEYYDSIKDKSVFIRSLPLSKKRRILEDKYGVSLD